MTRSTMQKGDCFLMFIPLTMALLTMFLSTVINISWLQLRHYFFLEYRSPLVLQVFTVLVRTVTE